MPDNLKNFWQSNIEEIKDNKPRFMAIVACFVIVLIIAVNDFDNGNEEIALNVETQIETVDNINTVENIEPVQNINVDNDITDVIGANAESLYVYDPFIVEQQIELEPIPTLQPLDLPKVASLPPPPVALEQPASVEKFILRGTAIIGENKSALIQKIIPNSDNPSDNTLILSIGDTLNNRRIVDIAQDFLIFDDGTRLYIDTENL